MPAHSTIDEKLYYVYIMANRKNGALYTGMTGDLEQRDFDHKTHAHKGFTHRYNITKLVWYESYPTAMDAITREKQIKHWKREWKIRLIKEMNPDWKDLGLFLNQ